MLLSLGFVAVLHCADKYKGNGNKKPVYRSMFEKIKARQMRNIDFRRFTYWKGL